jgi:hypothetical protein
MSRRPLLVLRVLLLTLALAASARAEEPVPLFVADVQLTGFSEAELREMEGWPAAFAAEVKGALAGLDAYTPMTLENLQAQLGKERLKATFACEDAACVNRIVENFGCSETIFTVVRRIGADKIQVTMDHTAGETVLHTAPPVYASRNFDGIRGAIQDLAGRLQDAVEGSEPVPEGHQSRTSGTSSAQLGFVAPSTGGTARPETPPPATTTEHPWVISPEWLALRAFAGSHGGGNLKAFALMISSFTMRWRWFYFTPAQLGLAFQKWSDDVILDVGPAFGVPFHLGAEERHEIRIGAWVPLILWGGELDGMGVNFEALYVYHVHEWFSVHAGFTAGALLWQFDSPEFMGGALVGFGL